GRHRRDSSCCKLLVVQSAYTAGKGVEANKSAGVALLIDVVFAEGHEALVVKRVFTGAANNCCCSFEEAQRHTSGHPLLRDVDKRIVGFSLSGPPASLVDE